MAKLYREYVLKEKPAPDLIQIGMRNPTLPGRTDPEPVGSCGD
jgi:hypothetical protein